VRFGENTASPPPPAVPSFQSAPSFDSVRSSEPPRFVEPPRASEPAPAYEPPRERPVANAPSEPAPLREPAPLPPRVDDAAGSSKGSDNKYVVWSSAPSDVQRSGPDER
jgi:hypothetical protein